MAAPISVVIPTLNAATALPGCVASLMEGVEAGILREVVISDGGSTDATKAIAGGIGARLVTGPASRGGQLRRGCAAAQGPWILLLHADTQLAPGWAEAARAHMLTGQAGWGTLRFDRGGAFVAGWANWRSRSLGLPYGDQSLLLPHSLLNEVGGVPDLPLMEDVALARALKGQLAPAGFTAVTSAEKFRTQGWVRRGARNLWTLARYFTGTSPDELAKAYRS